MNLKPDEIIAGHYRLIRALGTGSTCSVWLAYNIVADIEVAIKFYGVMDEKGLDNFRKEFKLAYKLNHPNLLPVSHFDVCDGCPYLVMPYCANGSVARQRGRMTEPEIWKFILDISSGLAFLHGLRPPIVHQDIKPDNVLVTSDGRYVISDFGISHIMYTQKSMQTTTNFTSGTLPYMGPERFSEHPLQITYSDIWSFGMTIYELVMGNVLWEGMGGCVQLNGAQIPRIPTVSPELENLIVQCLSVETWNRPTASQVNSIAKARLQAYSRSATTSAKGFSARQASVKPKEEKPVDEKKQDQSDKSHGIDWTRWSIVAVLSLVFVALVGGGIWYYRSFQEKRDFVSCQTTEQLEEFVRKYPSSHYAKQALRRIELARQSQTPDSMSSAPVREYAPAPDLRSTPAPRSTIRQDIIRGEKSKGQEKIRQRKGKEQDSQSDAIDYTRHSSASTQSDDNAYYACSTIVDLYLYLRDYPNGRHRKEAQERIKNMKASSEPEEAYYNNGLRPRQAPRSNRIRRCY